MSLSVGFCGLTFKCKAITRLFGMSVRSRLGNLSTGFHTISNEESFVLWSLIGIVFFKTKLLSLHREWLCPYPPFFLYFQGLPVAAIIYGVLTFQVSLYDKVLCIWDHTIVYGLCMLVSLFWVSWLTSFPVTLWASVI